eukprot:70796_1
MGNKGSKSKSKAKTSKIKSNDDKKESIDEINYTQVCDIGHKLPTPPLTMGSKLIFLSTNENKTVCSIYDLNKSEFTTRNEEIKCDNDDIYEINSRLNAKVVEGAGEYGIGIIDMLQKWDMNKKTERFIKSYLRCKPKDGISCVPPKQYGMRFLNKMQEIGIGYIDNDKKIIDINQ